MTPCADFDDRVDLIAAGELPLEAADRAHLDACAACRATLARARALDRALAARSAIEPPAAFTAQVVAAIRGQRWRDEQALDFGFNLAVAAGLLLVAAGLAGLAWGTGLIAVGGDLAELAAAGLSVLAGRLATQAPNVGLAALLLTMALGVWWWAEGIEA